MLSALQRALLRPIREYIVTQAKSSCIVGKAILQAWLSSHKKKSQEKKEDHD